MEYTFTFANQSAYLTSKASGALAQVYASTETSRSAVSLLLDSGKTVIDSINTIVPREQGNIGDLLLYHSSGVYYWLKGANAWSASAVGGYVIDTARLASAGYTRVGFCVAKEGKHCLLMSIADLSTYQWSTDTSTVVPGVTTFSSVRRRNGGSFSDSWITPLSAYWAELKYPPTNPEWGDYAYVLPFQRSVWDTVCNNVKSATAANGSFTQGTWKVELNTSKNRFVGTITTNISAIGSKTFDVADYNYDFDRWYRECMIPQIPTSTGAGSDMNGLNNSLALKTFGDAPAAIACLNYSVTGVPDFGAGKWWLGSFGEWMKAINNTKTWREAGCPINTGTSYWTSTQSSASSAWLVLTTLAHAANPTKPPSGWVRPFSAFHI